MPDIDLYAEHAKEKFGLPPTWRIYRYEVLPVIGETKFYNLSGCVCPDIIQGKRKGRPKWSASDKSTEMSVSLTIAEHDEWKIAWESKAGKCHECTGSGKTMASMSVKDGATYRNCFRCKGTGKPPLTIREN